MLPSRKRERARLFAVAPQVLYVGVSSLARFLFLLVVKPPLLLRGRLAQQPGCFYLPACLPDRLLAASFLSLPAGRTPFLPPFRVQELASFFRGAASSAKMRAARHGQPTL